MSSLQDDAPHVSDHARSRWFERTDGGVELSLAWERAQRVAGPEVEMGGDEARVFVDERVLLLRNGNTIVTVVSEREMQDRVRRMVEPVLPSHL